MDRYCHIQSAHVLIDRNVGSLAQRVVGIAGYNGKEENTKKMLTYPYELEVIVFGPVIVPVPDLPQIDSNCDPKSSLLTTILSKFFAEPITSVS